MLPHWFHPSALKNTHQVSSETDPSGNQERIRIIKLIFFGLSTLLVILGVRLFITDDRLFKRVVAVVIVLAGLIMPLRILWWVVRMAREMYRIRRGLCVHCGHPFKGVPKFRCTECGKPPC